MMLLKVAEGFLWQENYSKASGLALYDVAPEALPLSA